jgi:DNA-binding MarR family transcriptional regulator
MSEAIDLDRYFPYFLGTISNKWTAISSREYLREFGVGISEWRVLASLASLGSANSNEIVKLIAMDPGAVSRCMTKLERAHLVAPVPGLFSGRSKPFELTESGRELTGRIKQRALEREGRLLAGLTHEEREQLLRLMRAVITNLSEL